LFPVTFNLIPVHSVSLRVDVENTQTAVWLFQAASTRGQNRDFA
jgi:hypothetical protein